MAFQCVLVTPEQQAFDERVTQVILPLQDGLIGVLSDRAPMLAKLGAGPLRVDLAGNGPRRYYFVSGGVAQMKDNRLTILTDAATPASEIDAEAARAELAEATARRATDHKSLDDRQRQLQSARAKLALAERR